MSFEQSQRERTKRDKEWRHKERERERERERPELLIETPLSRPVPFAPLRFRAFAKQAVA